MSSSEDPSSLRITPSSVPLILSPIKPIAAEARAPNTEPKRKRRKQLVAEDVDDKRREPEDLETPLKKKRNKRTAKPAVMSVVKKVSVPDTQKKEFNKVVDRAVGLLIRTGVVNVGSDFGKVRGMVFGRITAKLKKKKGDKNWTQADIQRASGYLDWLMKEEYKCEWSTCAPHFITMDITAASGDRATLSLSPLSKSSEQQTDTAQQLDLSRYYSGDEDLSDLKKCIEKYDTVITIEGQKVTREDAWPIDWSDFVVDMVEFYKWKTKTPSVTADMNIDELIDELSKQTSDWVLDWETAQAVLPQHPMLTDDSRDGVEVVLGYRRQSSNASPPKIPPDFEPCRSRIKLIDFTELKILNYGRHIAVNGLRDSKPGFFVSSGYALVNGKIPHGPMDPKLIATTTETFAKTSTPTTKNHSRLVDPSYISAASSSPPSWPHCIVTTFHGQLTNLLRPEQVKLHLGDDWTCGEILPHAMVEFDLCGTEWDVGGISDPTLCLSDPYSSHTPLEYKTNKEQVLLFQPGPVNWLISTYRVRNAAVVILIPQQAPLRGKVVAMRDAIIQSEDEDEKKDERVLDHLIINLDSDSGPLRKGYSGSMVVRSDTRHCIGEVRGGSKNGRVVICVSARAQFNGMKSENRHQWNWLPCSCVKEACDTLDPSTVSL